jgi:hypothetical protein
MLSGRRWFRSTVRLVGSNANLWLIIRSQELDAIIAVGGLFVQAH